VPSCRPLSHDCVALRAAVLPTVSRQCQTTLLIRRSAIAIHDLLLVNCKRATFAWGESTLRYYKLCRTSTIEHRPSSLSRWSSCLLVRAHGKAIEPAIPCAYESDPHCSGSGMLKSSHAGLWKKTTNQRIALSCNANAAARVLRHPAPTLHPGQKRTPGIRAVSKANAPIAFRICVRICTMFATMADRGCGQVEVVVTCGIARSSLGSDIPERTR
jgi:hypothetical protein